ncbi:MAG: hypothetical protein IJ830_05275 [Alphaproteobacteria bacterium]|nr:hypothetical protein [Alphaproteobacteria bacterium]
MYEILNTINSPADVKKLNAKQLKILAGDYIRRWYFRRRFWAKGCGFLCG